MKIRILLLSTLTAFLASCAALGLSSGERVWVATASGGA